MSAQQKPAERDSVGKALARTANPAHAASLLRRAFACLRTRGWQALWREIFYRLCLVFGKEPWQLRADVPLRRELLAQRHAALPRQPLISVVVPLYNTPPRYLKEMVASVRAQSYQNWELVLVDASDASGAGAKLAARIHDKRVRYVRLAKNEGIAANTNVGLAEAEGEWITLLDHDDALSPNALYEVAKAAELVSDATRRILQTGSIERPVISSACPAVTRLIRVRFPQLIDHVLPLVAPIELAARLAKKEAVRRTGLPKEDIGCIFITPCPAKVTAIHSPIGSSHSEVDGAVAIKEVYPRLLASMKRISQMDYLASAGRIGLGWAESGGEAAGLISTDSYLAADGIENVIRVLEDLEDEKYRDLDFVELDACAGGCVGGVLQVENPYIAKAKIKRLRRYVPVSKNHLSGSIPTEMLWDTDLTYAPVLELGGTRTERFERYNQMEEILAELPGLDCGSCGAPTCAALAEDVVRGKAAVNDCTVLMRRRMEAVLKALGKGE